MSATHPIIAVTGSSGAGTTSVMRTFEQIFRGVASAQVVLVSGEHDNVYVGPRSRMRGAVVGRSCSIRSNVRIGDYVQNVVYGNLALIAAARGWPH